MYSYRFWDVESKLYFKVNFKLPNELASKFGLIQIILDKIWYL